MSITMKRLAKIRQEKAEDQPKLLVDQYYVYDNQALIQDTYTAKKLHNMALYDKRQTLFRKHKWLNGTQSYHLIKNRASSRENMLFRQMHVVRAAEQVIRQTDKDISNYSKALKAYNKYPEKFQKKPHLPKYLRHPRASFRIDKRCFHIENGYLLVHAYQLKLKIYQHYNLNNMPFMPVYHDMWIKPIHRGVKLSISYEAPASKPIMPDNGIYMGIDPGVDNIFACGVNTAVSPMLINGKPLKAINQWSNKIIALDRKQLAQYKQNAFKVHTKKGWQVHYADSHRIQDIFAKRDRKIACEAHNAIMRIIAYAQNCNAHTIIIGKNKYWKNKADMNKQNNQNFIGIPHAEIIKKLAYRASMFGIAVITTNESYTSQTSFLDNEKPVKQNGNKIRKKLGKSPINRRFKRGLFKSNRGIVINADVNAALQMIKKVVPKASFSQGIEDAVLHPVKLNPSFGY